ncbi:AAA domain (dynein-related subfamily) [Lachnospiraceae bacterium NE2001]|nr:AAA domain (dynein-related subfamily) [Lachnospiraceae bacterium NE2001]
MKKDEVEEFIEKYYNKQDNNDFMFRNEPFVVCFGSISPSREEMCFRFNAPEVMKKCIENKKRYFIFLGVGDACDKMDKVFPDHISYVFSLEPLYLDRVTTILFAQMRENMKVLNEQINKGFGIARVRVDAKKNENSSYNLVAIRVKDDNQNDITEYMDEYLASSDPCVAKDVTYPYAQFIESESTSKKNTVDIDEPRNLLVYGAPGTGKSHYIKKILKDKGLKCSRVTFYEDYSYEKFVGGYFPVSKNDKKTTIEGVFGSNDGSDNVALTMEEDGISYDFRPGIFMELAAHAWSDLLNEGYSIVSAIESQGRKDNKDDTESNDDSETQDVTDENDNNLKAVPKHILVIEELNRANAASVFGDMFQVLDRDENGLSEYGIKMNQEMSDWFKTYIIKELNGGIDNSDLMKSLEKLCEDFRIPPNLYLWATMNSADQGVFPLDSAFKRRWSFRYISAADNSSGAKNYITVYWNTGDVVKLCEVQWNALRNAINEKMDQDNIEEDRFIGPWFFKKEEMVQIEAYTVAARDGNKDLNCKINPICDKLYSYLRQDVYRNNPEGIFNKDYDSLYKIRKALRDKKGQLAINDVLIMSNGDEYLNESNGTLRIKESDVEDMTGHGDA